MSDKCIIGMLNSKIQNISMESSDESHLCEIVDSSLKDPRFKHSKKFKDYNINSYKDIVNLDLDVLSPIIEGLYAGNDDVVEMNKHLWKEGVARYEDIRADFDFADFSLFWGNSRTNAKDLLIRAIPGHAEKKHCFFRSCSQPYPNTTSVDVVNALAENPKKYKISNFKEFADRSQKEINDYVYWLESFFSSFRSKKLMSAVNGKNKKLGYFKFFRNYQFNMIESLRGFYFGANMDNYDTVRSQVKDKYGFEMGGGQTYAVDINMLKKFNISLREMAETNYRIPLFNEIDSDKRIKLFKEMGFIIEKEINFEDIDPMRLNWDTVLENGINPHDYPDKDLRKVYIRSAKGQGLADDVAIVLAAFLPQTFTKKQYNEYSNDPMSRHLAAFFADRIDTLEKDASIIIPGGQDEIAGKYLNFRFKQICKDYQNRKILNINNRADNDYTLINMPVLVDFTAASAITDLKIHSSQRYFLMSQEYKDGDSKKKTCTLKELIRSVYTNAYSRGIDIEPLIKRMDYTDPNIHVGFHKVSLKNVLKTIHDRIDLVIEPNKRENNLRDYLNK